MAFLTAVLVLAQAFDAAQLFDRARGLAAAQRYQEACPLFAESHKLDPALGTLLNLADCQERLGRTATAYKLFNEATAWAERTHESKRADVARQRATSLREKLCLLVLETPPLENDGWARLYDSKGNVAEQFGLKIPQTVALDPGPYRLEVLAEPYQPYTGKLEIGAVGITRFVVPLVRYQNPLSPPPATASSSSKRSPYRMGAVASWIVAAVGIVISSIALASPLDVMIRATQQQGAGAVTTVTRDEYKAAVPIAGIAIGGIVLSLAVAGVGIGLWRYEPALEVTSK